MIAALTLELPEPPSANRWWRNVNGRMVTSKAARVYKSGVALAVLCRKSATIRAPIAVSVETNWYRGRKSGDLDKRIGVLLDALQGTAYDNDSQITEITARRFDDKNHPRVIVTIPPLSGSTVQET
jgi:crossover junction endodeoxyribonuclease RusA